MKEKGLLDGDFNSSSIVWSSNGEETGRINIDVSTNNNNPVGYPYILLKYKVRDNSYEDWVSMDYRFELLKVPCNFSGFRWFFRCNLSKNGQYCGRRVAFLYSVGRYFGCRHCADLTYESCNLSKSMRYGIYRIIIDETKEDELYKKIKTKFYRGKPTRKFRRYLKYTYGDEWTVPEGYT